MQLGLCARSEPAIPDGAEALAVALDVSHATAVDEFARTVVERFGRIDLWVNNAGILAPIGPLAEDDADEIREHVETNVLGVAYGSAAFARHVRSRPGRGVLVNVTSGAARTVYLGWAPYCASKAAVDMLTAVLAAEEQERGSGLEAHALSPGPVDTDMQALIRATPASVMPASDRFRSLHREGRLVTPDWVAAFILDLAARPAARRGDGVDSVRRRVPDPEQPE